ncbi:hypothetical protein GF348_24215 [candidate division KSB3 bacterium]|nr:hypothetical protein [candidate division KSB3 bacterium]
MSRKGKEVAKLLEAVKALKQKVDTKREGILKLASALERFEAQYDTYIQTLQRRRQYLARRVENCRFLIQHGDEKETPAQSQQMEQETAPKPDCERPPEEPSESPPIVERVHSSDSALQKQRKQTRNFFAEFWHPDACKRWPGASPEPHLMHQLNAAFEEADDLVDLLTHIPWHEAWMQHGRDESLGMQWERLMDWQVALEEASGRLDRRLAELERHEFYSFLLEKRAADENGQDYLAQMAVKERDEISRLEETLAVLHAQLNEIESDSEIGVQNS